ncbi:hypothetical protein Gasu2_69560 [Galdieria sulphuraria]|uniref:Uncharacterized protein n=1 Tax=Galdieria sulphuraria TaxID=130081 RepID=M2X7T9_GALSU|nr:uncharacterized protein Gasu_03830 [Galdieria sulphuraria]EME32615.1 hypothetical protein Gasu_03830 [Galdieria sulphuraria]GJD12890.1 hypothetical protein Gasu2_69560 [Galdieria sulphuraria]|eukprot:XP_005709135.1 hypothetical protein Gasu_03830 [Galdieria sulphuraria]
MGFFEDSYVPSESREQDGFSCFQERRGESVLLEQQPSHFYYSPPADNNTSQSFLDVKNGDNKVNSGAVLDKPTALRVENLLTGASSSVSKAEAKRHVEGQSESTKIEDTSETGSTHSRKCRRCSSHDNLAILCERSSNEGKRISRVPSAEVLTDRGIFLYPSRDYASKTRDYHLCKSTHKGKVSDHSAWETSSYKHHSSNGLPPLSSHHVKNEEHLVDSACKYSSSLGNRIVRKNEDITKSGEKKTEALEDERKSDTNSRGGGIAEESFPTLNPYYSTVAFQTATIAANELQSELKATEELLNSAARRRRYQDAWYSSTFSANGSLLNDAASKWTLQEQQSSQLHSYSSYFPQPMAQMVSLPVYVNHPIPNAPQVATSLPGNFTSHSSESQQPSYFQDGNSIQDAATLTNRNVQLERQMMDLQLQLNELRNENAKLKMENQQLKQQVFSKVT